MLAWAARRQSDGPRWNRRPTWAPTTRWSSWPALTKPTKARVPIGPSVVEEQPGSFEMPEYQDDLIQKMVAANPHTVVVLHRGGSMDVQKWIARVPGLVHAIFLGQDGGRALAEILLGESKRITLELDQRSFAFFNPTTKQWDALPDTYNILVGSSSQDTPLKGQFKLKSELTSNP